MGKLFGQVLRIGGGAYKAVSPTIAIAAHTQCVKLHEIDKHASALVSTSM